MIDNRARSAVRRVLLMVLPALLLLAACGSGEQATSPPPVDVAQPDEPVDVAQPIEPEPPVISEPIIIPEPDPEPVVQAPPDEAGTDEPGDASGDDAGATDNLAGQVEVPPTTGDPSILDPVERILGRLERAAVAFDSPSRMRFGQTRTIRLLVSPAHTAAELAERLDRPAEADTGRTRVSPRMRAALTGSPGLIVSPVSDEVQVVSLSEPTEWMWDVTPTGGGRQRLNLALSALIVVDGESTPRSMRTFSRDIDVEVTAGQRLTAFVTLNWQWLWTALLVPLAAWGWAHLRSRRRGADPPEGA